MQTQTVATLDQNGRILIPSLFRKQNSWKKGSKLSLVQDEDGVVKIVSRRKKIQKAKTDFQKMVGPKFPVQDFLEFKKQEKFLEQQRLESLNAN